MASQAAKLRRKKHVRIIRSGRPPESGVMRAESGRKSRSKLAQSETEKQVMSTVVEARMRQALLNDGEVISEKEATNPYRGSAAGRRYLSGGFGKGEKAKARVDFGFDVAATWRKCMAINGYPAPTTKAMDMGRVRGLPIEDLNAQARSRLAANTMMSFEAKLGQAGNGCRTAFYDLFILDQGSHQTKHMDKLLQKACDALMEG